MGGGEKPPPSVRGCTTLDPSPWVRPREILIRFRAIRVKAVSGMPSGAVGDLYT